MPLKRRAAPRAEIMGWDGSDWQKLLAESAANPNLRVTLYNAANQIAINRYNTDGHSPTAVRLVVEDYLHAFNDLSWDRWRNNIEVIVLPSGTRTATGTSPDQTNFNAKGVIIWLDITAVSGTSPTLRIEIEGKDPAAGGYSTLAVSGTYSSTGRRLLICYPGATNVAAIAGLERNDLPLCRTWRIKYIIGGTNPSFTFSVGAAYVV